MSLTALLYPSCWFLYGPSLQAHVTSKVRGGGQEELPHVRGQGQRPRIPDCDGAGTAERRYPASEARGGDERSYPTSEVRGGGREEIPHAPKPEAKGSGGEEQPHDRGQGRWPGG